MKTSIWKCADGTTFLQFWCPGCECAHGPSVVRGTNPGPLWQWNEDRDRPTLSPSIRVSGTRRLKEDEYQRALRGEPVQTVDTLCHVFVRDGQIEFLGDCTHALRGQTVAIPDWPYED